MPEAASNDHVVKVSFSKDGTLGVSLKLEFPPEQVDSVLGAIGEMFAKILTPEQSIELLEALDEAKHRALAKAAAKAARL